MNRQKLLARSMICSLACTVASCNNDLNEKETPVQGEGERITVTATAGMPQDRPSTRLGFEETTDGSNMLKITWRPVDDPKGAELFSVLPGTGSANPSTFTLQSVYAGDAHKATFTGEIIPAGGATYYAVYPALPTATSVAPTAVPLDMTGQTGIELDENKVYMYSSSSYTAGSPLNFSFNHLTVIVKLTLNFPAEVGTILPDMEITPITRTLAGATMTDVTFSATAGLYTKVDADLTANPATYGNQTPGSIALVGTFQLSSATKPSTTVYLHVLPGTLTDFKVAATVGNKKYIGTISPGATIEAGSMYTKTVEMQKESFTVNTTTGAAYNYNNLDMQIGTWQTDGSPIQTTLATATVTDGKAAFPADALQSLAAGSKIWVCIPRVAKFFHTLTADEVDSKTLTLPDKDKGSTLKTSTAADGKPYENDWVVALYMGVNKDGNTNPTAKPVYWATGNIIATKTNAANSGNTTAAFHIATPTEIQSEVTTDYNPAGIIEDASDGYAACTPGSQWNKFGWADAAGLKTSKTDSDYVPASSGSISGTENDIARAQLGGSWRLPTSGQGTNNEFAAFADNDYSSLLPDGADWKNDTGSYIGRKYTHTISNAGSNGNTIANTLEFPATGWRNGTDVSDRGNICYYRSGTAGNPNCACACSLYFSQGSAYWNRNYPYFQGHAMLPVTE